MREGGNFLKRNNGGVRSGCESFLNGCYQRAGLTLEVLWRGRELRQWDKENGNNERWKDQEGDERRSERCSRKMGGSRREMRLALGTMVMRKPNQTLSRPTIQPAGDLIIYHTLRTRFTFKLFSNIFLHNVLSRYKYPSLQQELCNKHVSHRPGSCQHRLLELHQD